MFRRTQRGIAISNINAWSRTLNDTAETEDGETTLVWEYIQQTILFYLAPANQWVTTDLIKRWFSVMLRYSPCSRTQRGCAYAARHPQRVIARLEEYGLIERVRGASHT
jgi:hypothetical protein